MYTVNVNLRIPFEFSNVEGDNCLEAAENIKKLLYQALPIVIATNLEKVQQEMSLELVDINEA